MSDPAKPDPARPNPAKSSTARPRFGRIRVAISLAALSASVIAGYSSTPGAHAASAASTACPWVGSSAPIPQRVSQLLAHMTLNQKV